MCVLSVCVRERVCCDGGRGHLVVCARGCVWGGMRDAKSLGDLTENFIKKLKSIHTHTANIQQPHMHTHSHIT